VVSVTDPYGRILRHLNYGLHNREIRIKPLVSAGFLTGAKINVKHVIRKSENSNFRNPHYVPNL
jgi:hypothetical protein